MVRKITVSVIAAALLIGALCTTVSAATHTVYDEGNINTTYLTYFKDIVSGIDFNDNYVAFRSGQYTYTMVVGKLEHNNGVISLVETGKEYVFSQTGSYNGQYRYNVNSINNFSVDTGNYIIYSDVGDYPELVERGDKYEMLSAVLLCIAFLYIVVSRIFGNR